MSSHDHIVAEMLLQEAITQRTMLPPPEQSTHTTGWFLQGDRLPRHAQVKLWSLKHKAECGELKASGLTLNTGLSTKRNQEAGQADECCGVNDRGLP